MANFDGLLILEWPQGGVIDTRLFDHFVTVGMEVVMGNLVGNIAFYAEQFQGAFTGADGGIEYFTDNVIRPCL